MWNEIEREKVPGWLAEILAGGTPRFDLADITRSSAYYPACAFDGEPVHHLVGHVHSFIYADDGWGYDMFLERSQKETDKGFQGYHLIHREDVLHHLWRRPDLERFLFPSKMEGRTRMWRWFDRREAWAEWTVWKRDEDADPSWPPGFSLLYLRGEMSAVYQELYTQARRVPRFMCLICPGSFGGEWENALAKDSFIHEVMVSNPAGLPPYFLSTYMWGPEDAWPEYPHLIQHYRHWTRVKVWGKGGEPAPLSKGPGWSDFP